MKRNRPSAPSNSVFMPELPMRGAERLSAPVADSPYRIPGIVGNQKAAVFGHQKARGPSPDARGMGSVNPETGDEIVVAASGPAIHKMHPNHLVAGGRIGVPRTMQRHERVALVLRR